MKRKLIVALIVLAGGALLIVPLIQSNPPADKESPISFDTPGSGNIMTAVDRQIDVKINVDSKDSRVVEMTFSSGDNVLGSWKNPKKSVVATLIAENLGMGDHQLVCRATDSDGDEFTERIILRVVSDITPDQYGARILTPFPHTTTSFTQGLEFYQGRLFEGTGDPNNAGKTWVGEVDLATGTRKENFVGLSQPYFGEGITILNDKLYQITWTNGKCFVYDVNKLGPGSPVILKEFGYVGQGWGLCNDGTYLIMSNGSGRLYFRDPENFAVIRTLDVFSNRGPVLNLNELEYIDGLIYANIWQQNALVMIDPATGKVVGQIDATEVVAQGRGIAGDVLNGIAHNRETGQTYMTGKYYNKLFEVEFVKR